MRILFLLLINICLFANVGTFRNVYGGVEILRNGTNIVAKTNDFILENDKILVKSNGKAQIVFIDNTVLTLGKNSILEVKKYLINGANSKVNLKIDKGSYNVNSGEISKLAQKNFEFQAKTATIGIRGTEFNGNLGKEDFVACTDGEIEVKLGNKNYQVKKGDKLSYKNHQMIHIKKLTPAEFKYIKLGN